MTSFEPAASANNITQVPGWSQSVIHGPTTCLHVGGMIDCFEICDFDAVCSLYIDGKVRVLPFVAGKDAEFVEAVPKHHHSHIMYL